MNIKVMLGCAGMSAASAMGGDLKTQSLPITMNVDSLPLSLEPSKVTDIIANWLLHHLGQRLVETNASGTIRGNLAKSWEVKDEGKEFRFVLHEDAKFSDGVALKAHHVIDSIQRAMKNRANFSFYLENIESVKAEGTSVVVFVLKKPMPSFLQVLGEPMFTIAKPCSNNICFSGNYSVEKYTDKFIDLKRNSDGQIFRFEEMSFQDALERFKKGSLDVLRSYGAGNVKQVIEAPSSSTLKFDDAKSYFIALNTKSPMFSNKDKRAEFYGSLDLKKGEEWLNSRGLEISSHFVSTSLLFGVQPAPIRAMKPKDVNVFKDAKILVLRSHGVEELAKTLTKSSSPNISVLEKPQFVEKFISGDYDAVLIGYSVTLRDIDYLSIFFSSGSLHNLSRVKDESVDNIVRSGWLAKSAADRRSAFKKLLDFNSEELLYLPLTHCPLFFALSNRVKSDYGGSINTTALELDKIKRVQ